MSGDPVGVPRYPRGWRGSCGPEGPQKTIGPVAPVFMNLHVKCLIFLAKDDEDMESHPLHSNHWMNSQSIAEDAKYGRFYLTFGGDACLWYESITPVGNDWNHLKGNFFPDNSLN